jgi:hypothetical protein
MQNDNGKQAALILKLNSALALRENIYIDYFAAGYWGIR